MTWVAGNAALVHDETCATIDDSLLIVIRTVQQLLIYKADADPLLVLTTSVRGRHLGGVIRVRAGVIVNK